MMSVFVQSQRSLAKLIIDNYVYQKDKSSVDGEKMFWRCERHGTCKARVHTDAETDRVLKMLRNHNHAPDAAHVSSKPSIFIYLPNKSAECTDF